MPKPAADHGVVFVDPHADGLAVVDFFEDKVVDESFELLFCRGALPGFGKNAGKLFDPTLRNGNCPVRRWSLVLVREFIPDEQRCPDQEKVEEWLFEDTRHG